MTCRNDPFGRRVVPLVGFLLGVFGISVLLPFAEPLRDLLPGTSDHLLFYAVLALVVWCCTRADEVQFTSIGLHVRNLVPALAAVGLLLAGCNLVGIALASLMETAWGLEAQWAGVDPVRWLGWLVMQIAVIALVEEIAFRGYLQNKLLAYGRQHFGSVIAVTIAVTIGAALFAIWHVPGWNLTQPWTAHLPLLLALLGTGIAFGLIYHFSGNIYLVTLLHALGNTWPFAFDMADWPVWTLAMFWTITGALYLTTVAVCLRLQGPKSNPREIDI